MTIQSYFVLCVFIGTIIGLIKFQQRPSFIFGISLLILFVSNMVSTEQVLRSFSNQGLVTLILLLVCSLGLEKTRFLRVRTNMEIYWDYIFLSKDENEVIEMTKLNPESADYHICIFI